MSEHFDQKANEWDTDQKRQRAKAIADKIRSRINFENSATVMDFGAGTGLLSEYLATDFETIIAVDTSGEMLTELSKKSEFRGKLQTINHDILEHPVDLQLDGIVSSLTLHHIENPDALMKEFYRLLNKNGWIAIADLDKEDGTFHNPGVEGVHHHGFERPQFRKLLERNGFEEVTIETVHTIVHDDGKEFPLFLATGWKK